MGKPIIAGDTTVGSNFKGVVNPPSNVNITANGAAMATINDTIALTENSTQAPSTATLAVGLQTITINGSAVVTDTFKSPPDQGTYTAKTVGITIG